jgi:hypothetical protein
MVFSILETAMCVIGFWNYTINFPMEYCREATLICLPESVSTGGPFVHIHNEEHSKCEPKVCKNNCLGYVNEVEMAYRM